MATWRCWYEMLCHYCVCQSVLVTAYGGLVLSCCVVCMRVTGWYNTAVRRVLSRRHGDREGVAVRWREPKHGPIGTDIQAAEFVDSTSVYPWTVVACEKK